MEDLIFDIWGGFSSQIGVVTFEEFVEEIKTGKYSEEIDKVRIEFYKNGKSNIYRDAKKRIPAITFSGKFASNRKIESLKQYYPLMILDIDNIESEELLQNIFKKTKKNKFVYSVFRSVTGNGLKIIVKTNNKDFRKHTEFYKELVKYFESDLGIGFDQSTCDVSRLCFYSIDEDIYYNEQSATFEFIIDEEKEENGLLKEDNKFSLKMDKMVSFTNNRQKYMVGNRNNYLQLLSMNCSNHGIIESQCLEFCLENYLEDDFGEFEIMRIVKETYKKYKLDFGKWENKMKKLLRENSNSENRIVESKSQSTTIAFESDIFQHYYDDLSKTFPKKYTDFIQSLKSEREKEIVILTMMTVLNSIYQTE